MKRLSSRDFLHSLRLPGLLLLSLFLAFPILSRGEENTKPFGLVIHGGAGSVQRKTMKPEREKVYREKLKEALKVGYKILENNGSSLDAVEAVIKLMEDSPLFNAGKGAVFTHDGANELDASIMDGKTRNAGAAAGVKRVKNPISLARRVMEHSPHVFLAREGADAFARKQGLEIVPEKYFFTKSRWDTLQRLLAEEKEEKKSKEKQTQLKEPPAKEKSAGKQDVPGFDSVDALGTVGCVALDRHGNLAAGTSTGGMSNKRFGRIGDSPVIGAGTFADNDVCAVSATGHGEYFIRWVAAYDIAALMMYKNLPLKEAAEIVVNKKLLGAGGYGGIIAIDKHGNVAMPFSTPGMFRGYVKGDGKYVVQMFKDE